MTNQKTSIDRTVHEHLDDISARLAQSRAVLTAVENDGEGPNGFEQFNHGQVMSLLWTIDTLLEQAQEFTGAAYSATSRLTRRAAQQ